MNEQNQRDSIMSMARGAFEERVDYEKYNELLGTMIPDEPEPILSPHQPGDGGILTMPLRDNVPEPPTDDWQPTTCPVCGAECWQTDTARRILALEPDVRTACTACALKGLGK